MKIDADKVAKILNKMFKLAEGAKLTKDEMILLKTAVREWSK